MCHLSDVVLLQVINLLPSVRSTPAPPFSNTSVDFTGPVTLRTGYTRKPVFLTAYISVFICMATKAIHLELCESLSTLDFIATLKLFVARRGCPDHLYSDNDTNIVGAAQKLRSLQKSFAAEKH